jgi:hypothetical protein
MTVPTIPVAVSGRCHNPRCLAIGESSVKREEILHTLARFRERRQDEFGIICLGVFGSIARDQATEARDVDVMIELRQPDPLLLVGAGLVPAEVVVAGVDDQDVALPYLRPLLDHLWGTLPGIPGLNDQIRA